MKNDKLKKYSVRFGVAFLIVIAILTYFSDTIDNMLLPKVKVTTIEIGTLNEETNNNSEQKFLLPLSTVIPTGEEGIVFVVNEDEKGDTRVLEYIVKIAKSDDLYCEVTGDNLYAGLKVVYSTSKDLSQGDRVYVEEE